MKTQVDSYRLFQGFHLAFYKKDFYRYVSSHWKWRAVAHVAVLLLILWVFVVGRATVHFNQQAGEMFAIFAKQMPALTLSDGVASTKVDKQVDIIYPVFNEVFAVVNMNKTVQQMAASSKTAIFFLSKHNIGIREMTGTIATRPYPKDYSGVFGTKQLEAVFKKNHIRALFGFALVLYLVGFFVFFAFVMVYLSVLTTLISMLASGFPTPLKWRQCFALACAAATPILTIFSIAYLVGALSTAVLIILLIAQFVYLVVTVGFVSGLYQKRG